MRMKCMNSSTCAVTSRADVLWSDAAAATRIFRGDDVAASGRPNSKRRRPFSHARLRGTFSRGATPPDREGRRQAGTDAVRLRPRPPDGSAAAASPRRRGPSAWQPRPASGSISPATAPNLRSGDAPSRRPSSRRRWPSKALAAHPASRPRLLDSDRGPACERRPRVPRSLTGRTCARPDLSRTSTVAAHSCSGGLLASSS